MRLSALLLFITAFFSLTFPRSGIKIMGFLPITIPGVLLLLTVFLWSLENLIDLHLNPRRPGFRSLLGPLIFLYLAWGGLALVRGAGLAAPFYLVIIGLGLLGYTIIYFLMVSRVNTLTSFKVYAGIISISLFIVSIYGLIQERFGHLDVVIPGLTMDYTDAMNPIVLGAKENIMEGVFSEAIVKMFSTFHNGNLFGHHLTNFTPLIIALFFSTPSKRIKFYYLLIIILCAICLIHTASRGALAGFLGSIFFLIAFSRDKNLKIFMVLLLVFISLLIPFLGFTWRFVEQTRAAPTGGRLEQALFKMSSVSSIGDLHLGWLTLAGAGIGVEVNGVVAFHNTFLTIFLDLGLVGLFLFVMAILKAFIFGLRVSRSLSPPDFLSAFILGSLAGIFGALIHHLVDFLFLLPPIAQNFWMLVGLVAAAIQLKRDKGYGDIS